MRRREGNLQRTKVGEGNTRRDGEPEEALRRRPGTEENLESGCGSQCLLGTGEKSL